MSWPYSQLDGILRGIRGAEMTCIVSGTGQGKSTFTKELIHHLLMNDQKVGVLALEEANKRTALALVGVHMDRNLLVDRSQATDEEVVEAFDDLFTDRTCVLYDSWGSNQIDTICQRLMWMVRAHGITHAVLDHIRYWFPATKVMTGKTSTSQPPSYAPFAKRLDCIFSSFRI